MAFEPSIAVFDACILYPFHLRNVVVQPAVDRPIEARWTDAIHDEMDSKLDDRRVSHSDRASANRPTVDE
jgi:hypothetical protein